MRQQPRRHRRPRRCSRVLDHGPRRSSLVSPSRSRGAARPRHDRGCLCPGAHAHPVARSFRRSGPALRSAGSTRETLRSARSSRSRDGPSASSRPTRPRSSSSSSSPYRLSGRSEAAPVSAYTYAYTFFQFPFAIAATSIVATSCLDPTSRGRYSARGPRRSSADRYGIAVLPGSSRSSCRRPSATSSSPSRPSPLFLAARCRAGGSPDAQLTTASVLVLFAVGLPGVLHLLPLRPHVPGHAGHPHGLCLLHARERW